jgi:hypothetical protein
MIAGEIVKKKPSDGTASMLKQLGERRLCWNTFEVSENPL